MKRFFFLTLLSALLLISCKPKESSKTSEINFKQEGFVSIIKSKGDTLKFEAEFADNSEESAMGLMYRREMKKNQGMFFLLGYEQEQSFWMKNTYIPLDILFIDHNMEIVHIHKNAIPLDETMIPSQKMALYAFEINGGLSDQLGIKEGQRISFNKTIQP